MQSGPLSAPSRPNPCLAKRRLEHGVPGVTPEVVRALVEVAHARDVVLAVLAYYVAGGPDHHGCVPDCSRVRSVALQDGRHNHHVPLAREALAENRRGAGLCARAGFGGRVRVAGDTEEHMTASNVSR